MLVSINKVSCTNRVGASGVSDMCVNVLLIRLFDFTWGACWRWRTRSELSSSVACSGELFPSGQRPGRSGDPGRAPAGGRSDRAGIRQRKKLLRN